MKHAIRRRLILSTLTVVSLCAAAALPGAGIERGPQRQVSAAAAAAAESEARVIVKYRADSSLMRPLSAGSAPAGPQHAQALSARMGLSLADGRMLGARSQVVKGHGLSSRELADRLAAQGDVEYAVVDGRKRALAAPSDPLYGSGQTGSVPPSGQWYLRAPTSATIVDSTSIVSAINSEGAWGVTTGSSSIVVADLDTGVRFDHPDLTTKLLPGYDFIHNAANANDGSVADTDASDPGDFVTSADVGVVPGCTSSDVGDSSWHGTQTAGLIGAATDNGTGMASVGRNVMVQPLRVLGKCGGYDSDIQAAIKWAAGIAVPGVTPPTNPTPAKVINMSLGSSGACDAAYTDVIAQANARGVVVVVAAGNDGLDVGSPANCAGAIGVAGVRHSGTKVGYSDLGPTVAIAAPAGNCVNSSGTCLFPLLSTSNSGATTPVLGAAGAIYTGDGSNASLGTSFSAPLVSGTVALMFSANPNLTPAQVRTALQGSARAFPTSGAAPSQRTVGGPLVAVSACAAPTGTAQNYECYCTTSTCGAGLLDASAAVSAVAVTMANPSASPTSVVAGASVTLDGSTSTASAGNTISSYYWSLPAGTTIASFPSSMLSNGPSTTPTATLQTTAAGSVVVSLTVTDSAGAQNTNTVTVNIAAAPTPTPTPSSGGGGGGAMSLGWLLGWLACVVGVWVVMRRPGGRR